ncbi:protein kinase [Gemmatimonadota bacterium]
MIGKQIRHYRILEKLGEGGMGEVWLAEDTRLKRKVALKFLPARATSEEEEDRFLREARTASALDHPNICTIHEIGEAEDGRTYLAMAFYDGLTVKDLIVIEPPDLKKTLEITIQLGTGLARAHREGIIHRDIKSSNVILTNDGIVKIVDFGLAKIRGSAQLTRSGIPVGTAAYMSPEQIRGEGVDHRSDIWAMGVVLYEMLTGQMPFPGDSDTAVIYSVLDRTLEPVSTLRDDLPAGLETIVENAICKDPGQRYSTVEEMLTDLRTVLEGLESGQPGTVTKRAAAPSIVVLPFKDMSPEQDQEFFCDGMAEEIINALTQVESLPVVARTSAFSFKDKEIDVREIGKQLNVEHVLEGSIRKSGDRLRITAQLVKVSDGYHLWSERFDRNTGDVFAIQDEISLAITDHLKIKLLGSEKTALVKRHTDNPEAYNRYLRGAYFLRIRNLRRAAEQFQEALEIDPGYALAMVRLATVHYSGAFWGIFPPYQGYPTARKFVEQALAIDPSLAEAHAVMGFILSTYDWDWEAAENAFKQALQLNPNSALTHIYYSFMLTVTKRHTEAIAEARRARELDPLSEFINDHLGNALYYAGQFDESMEELLAVLNLDPNNFLAHLHLGSTMRAKGMIEKSIEEYGRAVELSRGTPLAVTLLASTEYQFGDRDRAEELFESLKQRSEKEYIPPSCLYFRHLLRGEEDEALGYLQKAIEERDSFIVWGRISPIDSEMIFKGPEFERLMDEAGLGNSS